MAKNNTNKIFSQETAEQHGFKPAYALNDGTGREVWVRGNGMNKQSIYVKPSPKMTTLSDYAFEKPNGEREYIGPKGKIPMFEEDIKRMVEKSVNMILREYSEDADNYYGGGLPDKYFDEDEDIEATSECDGYIVEDSKTGEIISIFRDKDNAIRKCDENHRWTYWGFNFKD